MSEQNQTKCQNLPQETIVSIKENLTVDKQTLFNKLQYPLSNIECQQKVIKRICSQLVSEEIFDPVVVNKYMSGKEDFGGLVWEFRNEDQETFLRFLEVLKNLHVYPATCNKFRKAINKVIPPNSADLESNVALNSSQVIQQEENQLLGMQENDSQAIVNPEIETFLKTGKIATFKSNVKYVSKICTVKRMAIIVLFITIGIMILIALSKYLTLQLEYMPINYNTTTVITSTNKTQVNFTEDQFFEFKTVDPNTVETKVNESLYSYNFL